MSTETIITKELSIGGGSSNIESTTIITRNNIMEGTGV